MIMSDIIYSLSDLPKDKVYEIAYNQTYDLGLKIVQEQWIN